MRWLLLALCVACTSEWEPAGLMLREGRNNDLAATQKYQAKELRLSGVVVSTGKKKIERGAARTDGRWQEAPATEADVPYPFVQIRDAEHPTEDVVTCYFAQRDSAPPELAPGATAHVHGFFVQYAQTGTRVEAVLERCDLE